MILLFKSDVRGYVRRDGSVVRDHFRRAAQFAFKRHQGQFRGDGKTPYIMHPVTVAKILRHEGKVDDPVTLAAALLHDTIEDTGATHDQLARLFGKDVADVVLEVTNDNSLPKAAQKRAQIEHGATRSDRANTLKIADKIANLRDIIAAPPQWTPERKRGYFDHARQVVEAMKSPHPLLKQVFMMEYGKRDTI